MHHRVLLAALLASSVAWAADPGDGPTQARIDVGIGLVGRSIVQKDTVLDVSFGGFSPTAISASGAYFFKRWLGVSLVANAGFFGVHGSNLDGSEANAFVGGFHLAPTAIFRWPPRGWLGLEVHLGWDAALWPLVDASSGSVQGASLFRSGPVLGAVVDLGPAALVQGLISLRGSPFSAGGSPFGSFSTAWLEARAQVGFGRLHVGDALGAVVLDYTLFGATGTRAKTDQYPLPFAFGTVEHRLTIGVKLRWLTPPASVVRNAQRGRVLGHVLADGAAVPDAKVELGEAASVQTDDEGAFTIDDLAPGTTTLAITKAGFKTAKQNVAVSAGNDTPVTISLGRPSGPGSIRGTVRSKEPDLALVGAEVTIAGQDGTPAVRTGTDGAFVIAKAGPGPVTVLVRLKGFKSADEVVQVPPEAEATLSLLLIKEGDRLPATLRGLIRSATGKPVRATVRVLETKARATVKGDGRFVMQVPGGTYTLVIEAPGFVSQTKTVEVADGDQAIFHVDLQPGSR